MSRINLDLSSTSPSEESSPNRNENIRKKKYYKPRNWGTDQDFYSLYRFSRENVEYLAEYFLDGDEETRGGALSNADRMRVCLRYMADPGFQIGVAEDVGIHQSTVCKIVWQVCRKIVEKSGEWIRFPSNENEFNVAKTKWQEKYNFPNAIGAIDGTLLHITKPSQHGDEYVCRKGFPAINAQATCNADEWFTSIDCSWAGSVHDARVWRNSPIQEMLNKDYNTGILLADEAYPLTPWVMTIYRNAVTVMQRQFNVLHKKERVIIERVFGQLKRRFPILGNRLRVATQHIPTLFHACCILHNIAKFLKEQDFEDGSGTQDDDGDLNNEVENTNGTILARGTIKRDAIAAIISRAE